MQLQPNQGSHAFVGWLFVGCWLLVVVVVCTEPSQFGKCDSCVPFCTHPTLLSSHEHIQHFAMGTFKRKWQELLGQQPEEEDDGILAGVSV